MTTAHEIPLDEDLDSLVARVSVMLGEIDLDRDMSKTVASNIAVGELSGTPMRETSKKLLVLRSQDRLSADEFRRFIITYFKTFIHRMGSRSTHSPVKLEPSAFVRITVSATHPRMIYRSITFKRVLITRLMN